MEGSLELSAVDHKTVLAVYRGSGETRTAGRAHVLLLLADGRTYREIMELLFCNAVFISSVVKHFRDDVAASILRESNGASAPLPAWSARVIDWLCERTPQDFGHYRSRWSCATLAELVAWDTGIRVRAETVWHVLRAAGYVWRRPRPVVGPEDPEYAEKRRGIQQLLEHLPQNETAVLQDEVEVHLNPRIGLMWMPRGQQAEVVTPGNNKKCHVAGSLVWRTGTLIASPPGRQRKHGTVSGSSGRTERASSLWFYLEGETAMVFYIYRDEDGYWRWRLATASNQVLAESPKAFHRKDDCRAIIQLVRNCGIAQVHEILVQMSLDQVPGNQSVNVSLCGCYAPPTGRANPAWVRGLDVDLLLEAGTYRPLRFDFRSKVGARETSTDRA